jgi:hypothetical protein
MFLPSPQVLRMETSTRATSFNMPLDDHKHKERAPRDGDPDPTREKVGGPPNIPRRATDALSGQILALPAPSSISRLLQDAPGLGSGRWRMRAVHA